VNGLVTKHLPLIAGAPGGIHRIRNLVRDLAIRGLLTPSIADISFGEGPQRGFIGKEKFALPQNWSWSTVGDQCVLENGDRSSNYPNKSCLVSQGIPFINAGHLSAGRIDFEGMSFIDRTRFNALRAGKIARGDILFCLRGSLGKAALVLDLDEGAIASSLVILRPGSAVDAKYLLIYLGSSLVAEQIEQYDNGTAQPNLAAGSLRKFLLPLPQLAEQHRIIAKVDELVALCDRLEADQADAEAAHTQLVKALLDSLTQATDAADFQASWQRLSEHFHTLFTTEASIDALKQAVLQLGLMGKLESTRVTDSSTDELLAEIRSKKVALFHTHRIPKPRAYKATLYINPPFVSPSSWRWACLGELGVTSTGSTPPTSKPECFGGLTPFIGPGQISVNGYISSGEKSLSDLGLSAATVASPGDILMVCIGGSIGKSAKARERIAFNQQINSISVLVACGDYVEMVMRSPYFKNQVLAAATGSATPIINRTKWEEICIPVPPVDEQRRIVAKIDEISDKCDRLKNNLTIARLQLSKFGPVLINQTVS
jgi:type I restriction enzyme, S subunit